jgi:hypothetical protein
MEIFELYDLGKSVNIVINLEYKMENMSGVLKNFRIDENKDKLFYTIECDILNCFYGMINKNNKINTAQIIFNDFHKEINFEQIEYVLNVETTESPRDNNLIYTISSKYELTLSGFIVENKEKNEIFNRFEIIDFD